MEDAESTWEKEREEEDGVVHEDEAGEKEWVEVEGGEEGVLEEKQRLQRNEVEEAEAEAEAEGEEEVLGAAIPIRMRRGKAE